MARVDEGASVTVRVDGRQRRGERSREKMVTALYELVGEGTLTPTAQQVASRAGVGLRTVFRHFNDMDTLFAEIDGRLRSEVSARFEARAPDARAPLLDRGLALVRLRADIYERLEPYLRSTRLHRVRSPFLQKQSASLTRDVRRSVGQWLPELDEAPVDLVDALVALLSFDTWETLRGENQLSRARTRAAMERTLRALLADL